MTHYFKSGNNINVEASDALEVLDYLPPAMYVIKKNPMTEVMYLQTTDAFSLPSKVYGDPFTRAQRIIDTFNHRVKSTGVLLQGEKGTGKTLLTKVLACKLIENNIPVIVVNEPWCGPDFNTIIGRIKQPAMILFDEFDKVYDAEQQQELLTLLDGTIETKKLFVLTTNNGHVDEHLINRPGRIYYKFNYTGLGEEFVREYLLDTLKNSEKTEGVVQVTNSFTSFTFDMLQALIEEMNRYDEDAPTVLNYLNIDLTKDKTNYSVTVLKDGKPISNTYYPHSLSENPLFTQVREVEVYYDDKHTIKDADAEDFPQLKLTKEFFHKISKGGVITYKYPFNSSEIMVIVEKREPAGFNWDLL